MNTEFMDSKTSRKGDCLAEKVDSEFNGVANPELTKELIKERIGVCGDFGHVVCKAAGCSASCLLRVSAAGRIHPDIFELGKVSDECLKMQEVSKDLFK